MANNQEHWKSLTNILLSVIGALLMFFGTISVSILRDLIVKVEKVTNKVDVQEENQKHLWSELTEYKNEVEKVKNTSRLFGKQEDEDQFKPRSR